MRTPIRAQHLGREAAALLAAAVGIIGTFVVMVLAGDTDTTGSAVFTLWIAIAAFEAGVVAGTFAAALSVALFALARSLNDEPLSWALVGGRGLPLLAVGAALGVLGWRMRTSEARNKDLLEGLPLAVYAEPVTGGGVTFVSPQIESLTGYPPQHWLGDGSAWRRTVHEEDRERAGEAEARARAAEAPLSHEYRLIRPDGGVLWLRDSSVIVRRRGERAYRQGFIVDVTAEREAQARTERLLVLMQALIDATVDAICLTDRHGNVQLVNLPLRAIAMELGLPPGETAQGQLLSLADRMVDPDQYRQRMTEIAEDPDTPTQDEFEFAETGRVFQGFTQPVRDEAGAFVGRVWTLREVTHEREVSRLKDELIATVSHELRTPLTSIAGYADLLAEDGHRLEETERRYVEVIRRNVARLRSLVEDLLLIGEIEGRGLWIKRSQLDLAEPAAHAVEAARPAAEEKELALDFEASGPARVSGDRGRLEQVAGNLIGNAIKFTPSGGRVHVEVRPEDGSAVLEVTDTGIGIPAAEQRHLFQRFFRSSSAADRHIVGTGLGLAIVKGILEAHGGEIAVESEEGRGTIVRVTLPLD
jgi:PAS domain S-box-containing protein